MIAVNIEKAKEIAHDKRREARAEEFKQLDIQATIPAMAAQAEQKRQEIRDKYNTIQLQIDAAESIEVLKDIISEL